MRVPGTLTADLNRRHLTGRLLPWGVEGRTSRGPVTFAPGSVHAPEVLASVILNREHDRLSPVGRLVTLEDDGTALVATFHVPNTPAGDQTLLEADAGLRTGLSVECSELVFDASQRTITSATLTGAAVVVAPAFEGAHMIELAASEATAIPEPTPPAPAPTPPAPAPAAAAPTPPAPAAWPAPAVTAAQATPRVPQIAELYGMLRAVHTGRATPEILAALSDLTNTANSAVTPVQYADQLWSHLIYQRQIVPLIGHADLTSYTVSGWQWVTPPVVAAWAGDKAAVPSNAATTQAVSKSASRLAGAHDVDRKFRDFNDDGFFAAYYAAMTESYAMLSDAAALADLQAAAQVVTPTAGQPLANVTAVYNKIRAYGPTAILVGFAIYDALAAVTAAAAPGGIVPLPWQSIIAPSPLLAAGDILGICRPAATFYELPSSPIRVEAVDMVKGGIDPGVFGYYATMINQAKGIAKATGATEFDAKAYGDLPVATVEAAPEATVTSSK